jgi:hypothetical protein
VDVAIEAVGIPATFDVCQKIVAPGGRIANVGVHGKPVSLELERLWAHNITLTTRLVDTVSTPMLLKLVQSGRLQPQKLVTHRFGLGDVMRGLRRVRQRGPRAGAQGRAEERISRAHVAGDHRSRCAAHQLQLEGPQREATVGQAAALVRQQHQAHVDVRGDADREPPLHAGLVEPPEDGDERLRLRRRISA